MSLLVGNFGVLDLSLFALRCLGRSVCVSFSFIVILSAKHLYGGEWAGV